VVDFVIDIENAALGLVQQGVAGGALVARVGGPGLLGQIGQPVDFALDSRDHGGIDVGEGLEVGIKPLISNEITPEQAFERSSGPLRAFMQKNVREKDLKLFVDMAAETTPAKPDDLSLRVLVPAFMISELKRAFEIGFLLFLPFLIIDLVVASVLMSMGMMMLPPVVVSLPFKLIFFVLVDGWSLVAGSLIQSYGT